MDSFYDELVYFCEYKPVHTLHTELGIFLFSSVRDKHQVIPLFLPYDINTDLTINILEHDLICL